MLDEEVPYITDKEKEKDTKAFDDINFIFNPNPNNPLLVGISTQSIRNITGYSYNPIPEWSLT